MARFRTRTPEIEAEQWQPGEDRAGVIEQLGEGDEPIGILETGDGGWVVLAPGDWIVTDPDGTRRACPAAAFTAHFEPAQGRP